MTYSREDKRKAAEWFALIQKRDTEAFEAFAIYFHKPLIRAAMRKGLSTDDASDVVSVTFEAVWNSAPAFSGKSEVTTWMESILRKKIVDFVRSEKRHSRGRIPLNDADDDEYEDADAKAAAHRLQAEVAAAVSSQSFDQAVYNRNRFALVRKVIVSLPPQQRRVAELAFTLGESSKEIALILDKPLGTVKATMNQVRKKLRTELVAQGYGENWNA